MGWSESINLLAAKIQGEFASLTWSSPWTSLGAHKEDWGKVRALRKSSSWYSWKVGHSNSHRKGFLPRSFPLEEKQEIVMGTEHLKHPVARERKDH